MTNAGEWRPAAGERGFSMIEVLISIIIIALGLLGLAGLQTRMVQAEMESYQRSHALILLQDMMNRIRADEADTRAGAHDALGTADADHIAWKEALQGVAGGETVGALVSATGCLESISASPKTIRVSIAWQGLSATAAPPVNLTCGKDATAFPDDAFRRVVSGVVVLPPAES